MAREHLFRGQRIDTGEWVYGSLIDAPESKFILTEATESKDKVHFVYFKVISESIGQFTSRPDKNSIKIFEGDVGYLEGSESLMVVEWSEQGCYKIQSPKNKMHGLLFCDFESSEFEIIGNIHENMEVLDDAIQKRGI